MLRPALLIASLFVVGLVGLESATEAKEKDEDACLRLHPEIRSPVAMARCTSDIDGSEEMLQTSYVALMHRLSPEALPELEEAQRSWLAFRDAQCEYGAGGAGGSGTGHSSAIIGCKADMNRARANELARDLERWPVRSR